MSSSGEFKLSISQALTDQLREHLGRLAPEPLTAAALARLDRRQGAGHFDALYPIELDWRCDSIAAGDHPAARLLAALKRELPFVLRYETTPRAKRAYAAVEIAVPAAGMSAEAILELVADALPDFQVTALPGYVILYKENRPYSSGRVIG